jgi:hypothetical protein
MLRLLFDQDFDEDVLEGLLRLAPDLDYVTARDIGMSAAHDTDLLIRSAAENRILVTHDRKTMPGHVRTVIEAGHNIAGVFIVPQRMPIARSINDLHILVTCSTMDEWQNVVRHLPLR